MKAKGRCADCISFRAVRRCRVVRSRVAIVAIEIREFGSEFVTQCELVGRKIPAGIRDAAALQFQREGSRPRELVCRMLGYRFQQPYGASYLLGDRSPAPGRA